METSTPSATTAERPVITVDVYSDVVCPWCYIGKRRFARGLELAREAGVDADVELTYRPFQLDPGAAPGVAGPVFDAYARKFGGPEQARRIIDHVTGIAAADGLEFRMDRALRANTLLAHRLLWYAARPGSPVAQHVVKERLLRAYFVEGLHVGDPDVLADLAADVGFDRDDVATFLDSDAGTAEVTRELEDGREQGVTAVPTYVINGTWAVPGAQEAETFAKVIEKMAAKLADDAAAG